MKNAAFLLGLMMSLLFYFGCTEEVVETPKERKQMVKLPAVLSASSLSSDQWDQIAQAFPGKFDLSKAQVVEYERMPAGAAFIFVPYLGKPGLLEAFYFRNGQIILEKSITVIDHGADFTASTPAGDVHYQFQGEKFVGLKIERNKAARMSDGECDVFMMYFNCEAAVAQQFAEVICGGCGAGQFA